MRLGILRHGQRLRARLILFVMRIRRGAPAPDIVRALFYRPEFFGTAVGAWTHAVMRGPSAWTVADRELFAAVTASLNQCRFCTNAHVAVASRAGGDADFVRRVVADWRTAPIDPKLRAMLGVIETLTLAPETLSARDFAPARQAGLSDQAIVEALHVCAQFNIYPRLADSLKFDLPGPRGLRKSVDSLLSRGYR